MTTELLDKSDHYVSRFNRIAEQRGRASWLPDTRREAIARFTEMGFPTQRDEEWRFTNVQGIAQTAYDLADEAVRPIAPEHVGSLVLPGMAAVVVFVDGRFHPQLSSLDAVPAKVVIANLPDAAAEDTAAIRTHMAQYAGHLEEPFTALNTAFMEDGAFIHILAGAVLTAPIQLLYISTADPHRPRMVHPRNLIVAETGSQATIIESYVGYGAGSFFTNTVTEIFAADGAIVDHYKVVRESAETSHVGMLQINQKRDTNVTSQVVSLGGRLVRNNMATVLEGEGGDCTLTGLYLADNNQHIDNHLVVDHAKPHCNSWEFFRGILNGHGRGVFSGRIIVREQAQKTDAKQTNKSLLLSSHAQVESKPQLEIFADDVKCTHGATIGQVSDEAVFYLRSRGLSREAARSMLVAAFARESLAEVRPVALRKRLDAEVVGRLPQGHLLLEDS